MDARGRLVASRPGALAYARTLSALPQDLAGAEARLAQLAIYPVKGLGGLALAEARVERRGLVDLATGLADRSVMLAIRKPGTTADGERFDAMGLSNRNEATLSLARASLSGGFLQYDAPGRPTLRLAPASLAPRPGEPVRVKLGYDGGPVLDAVVDEGPLAAWVRGLLAANPAERRYAIDDVVALRPSPTHRRAVAEKHRAGERAETLFGDGAHALVASATTLSWMNDALAAEGARRIDMAAFRPNVVLDGLPPNAEDLVHEAEAAGPSGPVRMVFATMCVRCDATSVDLGTGTRPDAQPLAWLARNRPPRDADANAATFAMNTVFPEDAIGRTLRVGDRVRVTRGR